MNIEKLQWRTEQRKINDLIPFLNNPRRLSKRQFTQLEKSIKKFDLVEIPVIDTDNNIIAGHQRIKIMQFLNRGDELIDVRVPVRKLTDAEFREYNLRSNKNIGEWDFDILTDNFDVDLLKDVGFDDKDFKDFKFNIDDDVEEKQFDKKIFTIVVEFDNEKEQKKLYEQLTVDGYNCKVASL